MATGMTSIPAKDIKIEGEMASRKDEVKVTNLLSEIRTTDLLKESPMQVDTSEEKESNSKDKEEEKPKNEDNKMDEKKDTGEKVDTKAEEVKEAKNGNKKAEEVKKVDNGNKKAEEVKKVDNGNKKAEEVKKVDNGNKKAEEVKKVDNGNKKAEEVKKMDNGDKKAEEVKKIESEDKKTDEAKKDENGDKKLDRNNTNSGKTPKTENVSPLASFFQDWDKFSTKEKVDIERFIRDKAEEMGASSKLKPGVRTLYQSERNRNRWNAIRRRESRRRESLRRLERSRSLRDRGLSRRGAGDGRSRNSRDDRRWRRYSPRREALPWRSPWDTHAAPVETLIKQMERFVQMVDKFPNPNNMIQGEPKRLALLPTPPDGYNMALRWPVQQYPINGEESSRRFYGKEPSSQSLSKSRPTPYNSQPAYSSNVVRNDNRTNRERKFSQTAPVAPYEESRFTYATTHRR